MSDVQGVTPRAGAVEASAAELCPACRLRHERMMLQAIEQAKMHATKRDAEGKDLEAGAWRFVAKRLHELLKNGRLA